MKVSITKNLLYLSLVLLAFCESMAQTADQTYIKTYKASVSLTGDISTVNNKSQVAEAVEYYDGLGRSVQSVMRRSSALGFDVVTFAEYDAYGRKVKTYLPYVSSSTTGSLKTSTIVDQAAFYTGLVGSTDGTKAFSILVPETSDLNRTLKQGSPGSDWQPDGTNTYASTDHTVKKSFEFNSDGEVLKWTFTAPDGTYVFGKVNAGSGGIGLRYAARELYKSKTKDEEGHEVIEYADKEGHTVLKRVQATMSFTVDDTNYASTYYIYDDYSNLVCVIPPEATKNLAAQYYQAAATDATKDDYLKRWAFRYKYDGRKRMIQKQVPGADPVYMVYDIRDRLILTQDGNQRSLATKYWSFTKYDEFNRPVMTGIKDTTVSLTQSQMQNVVDAHFAKASSRFSESYVGSAAGTVHGYTNKAYPARTGGSSEIDPDKYLSVTYYDNYSYKAIIYDSAGYSFVTSDLTGDADPYSNQKTNYFKRLTGQVTGTKVKVLDGGVTGGYTWLKTVNYYDDRNRLIQVISDNYKGGTDRTTNAFDFAGKLMKTKSTQVERDVTWKDRVGVSLTGNRLNGTGATGWGNSGAASVQQLPGGQNGWAEMISSELTKSKMLGLSDANTDASYSSLDYAMYQYGSTLMVYESGTLKYTSGTSLVPGEVLRIERNGTSMTYKRNGTTVYTSTVPSSTLLMVDVAHIDGGTLVGIRSSFSTTSHTAVRRFVYDHTGRLLKTYHKLDAESEKLLVQNDYNELGQLVDKKLYSTNGTAFKQSQDYRYNIRGWLTKINESDVNNNESGDPRDFFGMELLYNQVDAGIGNTGAFNGNISAMKWSKDQSFGTKKENAYAYGYDPMNRITGATFKEKSSSWALATSSGFSESSYTYDQNGNIQSLVRYDKRGTTTPMDNLVYNYGDTTTSNKLMKVTDSGDDFGGFVDGTNTGDDYTYDLNGNMITDQNKGITTAIGYNYLNLPETISKGGISLQYIYDASGRKLSQVVTSNARQKQTEYSGEYQYEDDVLQFIGHEEGRITMSSTQTMFSDDATVTASFTSVNTTLSTVTQGTEKYVKVVSNGTTGGSGAFPIGGTIPVTAGERYKIRARAYRDKGTAASSSGVYLSIKANGTSLDWPGALLPISLTTASNEMWTEQVVTMPAGATTLQAGLIWSSVLTGEAIYINDFEITKLTIDATPEYQFNLKDHLGNVRVTFTTKSEVDVSLATFEPAASAVEQSKFLRYENSKRINATIFDHTHLTNGGSPATIYSNDFNSTLDPLFSDGTIVMSIVGNRLKASNVGPWNNINFYQATVAGHRYRISFDIDLAGGPPIGSLSHDANQGYTAQVGVYTNGHYSYEFTSITNETLIFFQNGATGSREYYLDNLIIQDLSPNGTGSYSQRLNGTANEKFGLAKSLSVMPGDTVKAEVFASYLSPPDWGWGSIFTNLVGQIAANATGVVVDGAVFGSSTSSFPFPGLGTTTNITGGPKAYLNWLIFDRNYQLITGGFDQINPNAVEYGQGIMQDSLFSPDIIITQPGYVYIYLSNEEPSDHPIEVYFDDFKVTHVKTPVMQIDDYYPFGLTFNSYKRESSVINKRLYNAGSELQTDLDLGTYITDLRMYDPAIDRWWQTDPKPDHGGQESLSPYQYSFNNPIRYNDPKGDCPPGVNCNNPLATMQVRRNTASHIGPGYVRTGGTRFHAGHDLHAPTGTNVSSSLAGKVVSATNAGSNGYGNTVVVKSNIHPEAQPGFVGPRQDPGAPATGVPEKNLYVQYSHLETMNVATGATVTSGQSVGTVGITGNASTMTGPDIHLHINVGTGLSASGTSIPNSATVSPNIVYNNISFASANPAGNQSTTGVVQTTTNAQGVQTSTTLQPNQQQPQPQQNDNPHGTHSRN